VASRARAVIFTALDLETRAVVAHLDGVGFVRKESLVWRVGTFDEGLGWEVHVVQTGAENAVAGPFVATALTALAPAVAIFVGVAGGRPDAIEALDVIVPNTVEYLHAGKGQLPPVNRSRQSYPSIFMMQAAQAVAAVGAWTTRIVGGPPEKTPGVRFEPLGSGEQVIKSVDSAVYKDMLSRNDKIVAVDMEGTGFLNASGLNDALQYLLIRGISDLIDDKNVDSDRDRQPRAAAHAAAFAFETLALTPFDQIRLRDLPHPLEPFGAPPSRLDDDAATTPGPECTEAPAEHGETTTADDLVPALAVELAKLLDLGRWHQRTEGLFFGAQPTLPVPFDERLENAIGWLAARVPIPGASAFDAALQNLHAVLIDLRDVFHRHVEMDRSGRFYRTEAFYRDYKRPISEREDLVAQFRAHTALVKNLGAEATRAINLVAAVVRAEHDPSFGLADGAAGILNGDEFLVCTYTDTERAAARPYPGLDGFAAVLAHRDGVFPGAPQAEEWPEDLAAQLQLAVAAKDSAAASSIAYRLAQALADGLPAGWSTTLTSGHERSFDVRVRVVTAQWRSPDGVTVLPARPHLARTYMSPRGPDERREALVGSPEEGALGETLEPAGGGAIESLSAQELLRFSRETDALLRAVNGEDAPT
jgi:nucleoside phosphorylase